MRQIRLDPSKLERRGPTKIPNINKREGGEDYYLELESSTNIILIFYFSAKAYWLQILSDQSLTLFLVVNMTSSFSWGHVLLELNWHLWITTWR